MRKSPDFSWTGLLRVWAAEGTEMARGATHAGVLFLAFEGSGLVSGSASAQQRESGMACDGQTVPECNATWTLVELDLSITRAIPRTPCSCPDFSRARSLLVQATCTVATGTITARCIAQSSPSLARPLPLSTAGDDAVRRPHKRSCLVQRLVKRASIPRLCLSRTRTHPNAAEQARFRAAPF